MYRLLVIAGSCFVLAIVAACGQDATEPVGPLAGAGPTGGGGASAGAGGIPAGGGGHGGSGGQAGGMVCETSQADVVIQPGEEIQAAVDANPEGTSFLLAAGLHRMQSVAPKAGDVFYGALATDCTRLTVLSGARELASWQVQNSIWVHGGQTQEGQVHGQCEAGWDLCNRPEDLFVDDVPLRHVPSFAEVGPGTWAFDYAADTVAMGDDPAGHKVEIGVTRVAFSPSAPNVRIQGLIVEKYAIPPQMGAIGDQYPATGWDVEGNEVRWNHGAGINLSTDSIARNNTIHDNGQKGIGASGANVLVEHNEIAYNNYAHFAAGWEAGGSKFSSTQGLVVRRNCVHHNAGPGLWTDIDNQDVLYEQNVAYSNRSMGIFHEISFAAVIRDNWVGANGEDFEWLYGSQILVSTSQDVDVYDNVVEVAADYGNGIGIIWQNRPPYQGIGNQVHDNDVTFLGDGVIWNGSPAQTGVAADFDPATTEAYLQNSLDSNHYHAADAATLHFAWNNQSLTFAELQQAGQEAAGALDSTVSARQWSCDLVPGGW